jgi:hypothetical protein
LTQDDFYIDDFDEFIEEFASEPSESGDISPDSRGFFVPNGNGGNGGTIGEDSYIDDYSLGVGVAEVAAPEVIIPRDPGDLAQREGESWREVVVDSKTGLPRQAGAGSPEGEFIKQTKLKAETDLYVFSVAIMGRSYLTRELHLPICRSLQQVPPYRKLKLMPRDHAKTSIVGHCLPPHIIIQPAETNIYFKGLRGTECRILLSGETEKRAKGNLRVIRSAFEGNQLLRTFWPEAVWPGSFRDAPLWNDLEIIVPRDTEYPDPTVRAIGVGGAITGARPNVLIKDDLISIAAANSDLEMETAIEWHKASRALMDEYEKTSGLESLEFIIGTRWAVHDLYSFIQQNDPTVEIELRAIIEDGKPIWPERFDQPRIDQLHREFGSTFFLLYMNSANDPNLVDFNMDDVRECGFEIGGEGEKWLTFEEDMRDAFLIEAIEEVEIKPPPKGSMLNADTWKAVFGDVEHGRGEYMRLKYG